MGVCIVYMCEFVYMTLEMAIIYIKHTEEEGVLRGLVVALCAPHTYTLSIKPDQKFNADHGHDFFILCVYICLKLLASPQPQHKPVDLK